MIIGRRARVWVIYKRIFFLPVPPLAIIFRTILQLFLQYVAQNILSRAVVFDYLASDDPRVSGTASRITTVGTRDEGDADARAV